LFEAGLIHRRKVLGDAWVDKSLAKRTDFTADYQAMITRYAWNEIWGRPGLDHRTRRLLVLAICASLARWEEFRLHVRAGLEQGGFTRDELKEVLMQTAIYAGVPAANTAFTEAAEIIAELDAARRLDSVSARRSWINIDLRRKRRWHRNKDERRAVAHDAWYVACTPDEIADQGPWAARSAARPWSFIAARTASKSPRWKISARTAARRLSLGFVRDGNWSAAITA
jgi:4-carboxymuconolactone decarboxylase